MTAFLPDYYLECARVFLSVYIMTYIYVKIWLESSFLSSYECHSEYFPETFTHKSCYTSDGTLIALFLDKSGTELITDNGQQIRIKHRFGDEKSATHSTAVMTSIS